MFLLPLALVAHAADDAKPDGPTVKPSGLIFGHYLYDLSEGAEGYNEFGVDRVYVRADATLNKHLATRVTLDADRMKAEDADGELLETKYRVFVKHAYLEVKDLVPGLKLRGGMVETPYAPFYDSFWGNRYITESFVKNQKLAETADLGVGLWGNHGKGLVDWNLSLLNGEGYGKIEKDAGKSVQGRISIDPMAKNEGIDLPISGFVNYDTNATDDVTTLTWAGAVGFKHPNVVAWGEAAGASSEGVSGFGYSGTLCPRIPKVAGLVLRYDHFDPDTATERDANTLLIAGVERPWFEKVATAITYERTWTEVAADPPIQLVALRMQAGF